MMKKVRPLFVFLLGFLPSSSILYANTDAENEDSDGFVNMDISSSYEEIENPNGKKIMPVSLYPKEVKKKYKGRIKEFFQKKVKLDLKVKKREKEEINKLQGSIKEEEGKLLFGDFDNNNQQKKFHMEATLFLGDKEVPIRLNSNQGKNQLLITSGKAYVNLKGIIIDIKDILCHFDQGEIKVSWKGGASGTRDPLNEGSIEIGQIRYSPSLLVQGLLIAKTPLEDLDLRVVKRKQKTKKPKKSTQNDLGYSSSNYPDYTLSRKKISSKSHDWALEIGVWKYMGDKEYVNKVEKTEKGIMLTLGGYRFTLEYLLYFATPFGNARPESKNLSFTLNNVGYYIDEKSVENKNPNDLFVYNAKDALRVNVYKPKTYKPRFYDSSGGNSRYSKRNEINQKSNENLKVPIPEKRRKKKRRKKKGAVSEKHYKKTKTDVETNQSINEEESDSLGNNGSKSEGKNNPIKGEGYTSLRLDPDKTSDRIDIEKYYSTPLKDEEGECPELEKPDDGNKTKEYRPLYFSNPEGGSQNSDDESPSEKTKRNYKNWYIGALGTTGIMVIYTLTPQKKKRTSKEKAHKAKPRKEATHYLKTSFKK